MKIYKIECEWDMGFKEAYKTREQAEKAIQKTDWTGVFEGPEDSIEQLIKDGYLSIREIEI